MKTLVVSFVMTMAAIISSLAADPLTPAEISSLVAKIAPNETIHISGPVNGAYTISGTAASSGRIVPWGDSWRIYYNGKTHDIMRNGSGWTVYSGR